MFSVIWQMIRWPSFKFRLSPATRFWLAAYGCLACAHLGAKWWQFALLSYATKPLLMALLLAHLRHAKAVPPIFRVWLSWGLAWALLGDVFLMLAEVLPAQHDLFYLSGMGSFLLTHLAYIVAFAGYRRDSEGLLRARPWAGLPVVAAWLGVGLYVAPGVPPHLFGPTAVYATTLAAMALAGLNLARKMNFAAWYQMFGGVSLFMLSDSMIAVNKHRLALPQAGFWIMLTYLLGQYLIVEGSLNADREA
jgi:uncharacterized membrane protein YhhN